MSLDELRAKVLRLDPQTRAYLARELLASLDTLTEAEIEKLWTDEAVRRDEKLDSGGARPIQPTNCSVPHSVEKGALTHIDSVEVVKMKRYTRPTRTDYEEFLVQVVYGPCTDYLLACIRAAYLDFCRTMRGYSKVVDKQVIHDVAVREMRERFCLLPSSQISNQDDFDAWHRQTSDALVRIYAEGSFDIFAGQTQKWINMTFKNIFVCGKTRAPGYDPLYPFCHMPIDNVVLDQLVDEGLKGPAKAWSRWGYDDYLAFQARLRQWCGNQPLLNVEHCMWIEGR